MAKKKKIKGLKSFAQAQEPYCLHRWGWCYLMSLNTCRSAAGGHSMQASAAVPQQLCFTGELSPVSRLSRTDPPCLVCVHQRALERASPSVTPPSPAIGHFRCTCLTHLPITRLGCCAPRWRLPVVRIIHLRIWNLNMTIFQSFKLLRRQTRSSRAGLSCSQWNAETVSPWFLRVRSRVRCQSKGAVLSEYGHREQDQFLEEKRKGSWKVSFGNFLYFLNED